MVDTSVFIEAERRNLQALERFHEILADDALVVSIVTVSELLASSTLPEERRRFYGNLFRFQAEVLPVTVDGGYVGIGSAQRTGGGAPADILIAGTAIEHGLKVVTYDAGLARLLGPSAELLRAS